MKSETIDKEDHKIKVHTILNSTKNKRKIWRLQTKQNLKDIKILVQLKRISSFYKEISKSVKKNYKFIIIHLTNRLCRLDNQRNKTVTIKIIEVYLYYRLEI